MFHWGWTWLLFALNQDGYGDFVLRTRSIWSTSGVSTVFHQELRTYRDLSTSFKSECLRAFRCPPSCEQEKKRRQATPLFFFLTPCQTFGPAPSPSHPQ